MEYSKNQTDAPYMKLGPQILTVMEVRHFKYNTGNDGLELHVTNGEQTTAHYKTIKTSFALTPAALFRLGQMLEAAGWTDEDIQAFDPNDAAFDQYLVGLQVGGVLTTEEAKDDPAKRYTVVRDKSWFAPADLPRLLELQAAANAHTAAAKPASKMTSLPTATRPTNRPLPPNAAAQAAPATPAALAAQNAAPWKQPATAATFDANPGDEDPNALPY